MTLFYKKTMGFCHEMSYNMLVIFLLMASTKNVNDLSLVSDKTSSYQQTISRRRAMVQSIKAKANMRRSGSEKFADWMTEFFGTIEFLWFNIIWFVVWLLINTGAIPFLPIFDPFPFGVLTMVVSLEAIFLAVIVLISQNRAARISELREEIDIQVNIIAETEITKIIKLVIVLLEKNGVSVSTDPELRKMLSPIDMEHIEQELEKQI